MSSTMSLPPTVNTDQIRDVLATLVYQLEAAHFHLDSPFVKAESHGFRIVRDVDDRLTRAGRAAMTLLQDLGHDRAPMCQPWPEVMPDGWRGPTCWAENDRPTQAFEHEPEPCEYDLGDCDMIEREVGGEDLSDPDAFDAWLQEECVRG